MSNQVPVSASNDLSDMRRDYRSIDDGLDESTLPTRDPIKLFGVWFEAVKQSKTIFEPNAFCLSTVNSEGAPSSRMVLLKGFDDDGFRFFTNYSSQKGQHISQRHNVAILFYWDSFNRQVRIEGVAEKLPDHIGEEYFKRRPQHSQVGAAISDQTSLVESREVLLNKYNQMLKELGDSSPPKPATWGGYIIKPNYFEFWQGNTSRVHDRITFRRSKPSETFDGKLTKEAENGWVMERKSP